jgi:hypothetical protein
MSQRSFFGAAVVGLVLLVSQAVAKSPVVQAVAKPPVVVELFTSQGCSSCPPAEAFLNDLTTRPDIVALEYHVDYWDYIGWKDPFGRREYTKRQQAYSESLGGRYVYTPQMVINGAAHEVGSKRDAIERLIQDQQTESSPDAPELRLTRTDDSIVVNLSGPAPLRPLDVVFIAFDGRHETKVTRGENSGQTLVNAHVVRGLERLGQWSGGPAAFTVELKGRKGDGGCAVIVQASSHGPIAAAAMVNFSAAQ